MFGRRRARGAAGDAREAGATRPLRGARQAPGTICPSWAWPTTAPTTTTASDDEHRCYAFGDPAELSAEQQHKVCLQPGYGNCPRYLRGVLVIPTEELEALRRAAAFPPPARSAAASDPYRSTPGHPAVGSCIAVLLLVGSRSSGGGYLYLRNQVPSSAVADAAGGSAERRAPQPVGTGRWFADLHATAAIGGAPPAPDTTLVYVLDLSGAPCGPGLRRRSPTTTAGRHASRLRDRGRDGAERPGRGERHGRRSGPGWLRGRGGRRRRGHGRRHPGSDSLRDADSGWGRDARCRRGACNRRFSAGARSRSDSSKFTPGHDRQHETTDFSAGIQAACQVMDETDQSESPRRLPVGWRQRSGDPVSTVLPCDVPPCSTRFAVGADAGCAEESELGGLQDDRRPDGWRVHPGRRPDRLPDILESVVVPQILRIQLAVDGGDPIDISREASPPTAGAGPGRRPGDLSDRRAVDGEHELCVTVFASDAAARARSGPAPRWTRPGDP